MVKLFPRSRLCVIDIYPAFEEGLKKALSFTKANNISLTNKDGRKIMLAYCLESIQNELNNTKSSFPKVACLSKSKIQTKLKPFVDAYFETMMEYVTFPYCGKYDLTSPDLEFAAENSLRKQKPIKRIVKVAKELNLRNVN